MAGDLFVTVRFAFLPKRILVKDHGTEMTVYAYSNRKNGTQWRCVLRSTTPLRAVFKFIF